MAVINLRNVPNELARMVKATAASEGVTQREFILGILARDIKRGGWTAGEPAKLPQIAKAVPVEEAAGGDIGMDALRRIGAGEIPVTVLTFPDDQAPEIPEIKPVELCGHRELNPLDGEMYICRLPKHGKKVAHQPGERVES